MTGSNDYSPTMISPNVFVVLGTSSIIDLSLSLSSLLSFWSDLARLNCTPCTDRPRRPFANKSFRSWRRVKARSAAISSTSRFIPRCCEQLSNAFYPDERGTMQALWTTAVLIGTKPALYRRLSLVRNCWHVARLGWVDYDLLSRRAIKNETWRLFLQRINRCFTGDLWQ